VSATVLDKVKTAVPPNVLVRSLNAADLDGDGSAELIAAFAPTMSTSPGAVVVCTMQAGVAQDCEDVVPAIAAAAALSGSTITQCFDAAPAHLSYRDPTSAADASFDVAVVCRGTAPGSTLFRVHRGASGDVVDRLASIGDDLGMLRTGDVTGDHVDDLVLLGGEGVTSLVVFPQCTSRDAASCQGTSEEVSP
jgi:hypothetical protein